MHRYLHSLTRLQATRVWSRESVWHISLDLPLRVLRGGCTQMPGPPPSPPHSFLRPCAPWLLLALASGFSQCLLSGHTFWRNFFFFFLLEELLRYLCLVRPGIFILAFHFTDLIHASKLPFRLLTQSNNSVTLTAMDTWRGLKK